MLSVDLLWTAISPPKLLHYCKMVQTVIAQSTMKLFGTKGNHINLFYSTYMKCFSQCTEP